MASSKEKQEHQADSLQDQTILHVEDEAVIDKRINRKLDMHIMPWLFGIWLFCFIDRANIGNAKIEGLPEDLGIATGTSFNTAITVFFIPYILIDVPANWVLKKVKAGNYLSFITVGWGLTTTFLGFVKSFAGLVVGRLFLGAFEGALLGGIVCYLAFFYRRREMAFRIGLFFCAAPLSNGVGGLLCSGLARIHYGGYNGWPWIFFIQGILTTVFGIMSYFALPHTPADAGFLTDQEKTAVMRRMKLDAHGATAADNVEEEKFSWHWVRMAVKAPQTWLCALAWFFVCVPLYSFFLFLPTIIKGLGLGKTTTTTQLLTVPPCILSTIAVLVLATLSDKIRSRGFIMASSCLLALVGYVMMLAAPQISARYVGAFFIATGIFPAASMVIGWLSNNLAPHFVRATGMGLEISLANTSAFISSYLYLPHQAPDYHLGHAISIGSLGLAIITILFQIWYLDRENKKKERGEYDYLLAEGNEHTLGHRHPSFRYAL